MPGGIIKINKDKVVASIPDRNRLAAAWGKAQAGIGVLVLDAFYGDGDGDETVTSPSNAFYKWNGNSFVKISEGEGLDITDMSWKLGGNEHNELKKIGTIGETDFPIITYGVERARVDSFGNVLIGIQSAPQGKVHIRTFNNTDNYFALYVDNPALSSLFAVTNGGRFRMNHTKSNLLINGGWTSVSGINNLVITSGDKGGQLVETGSNNVVIGYNAGSGGFGGANVRNISRNVIIGASAGSGDQNGTNLADSVVIGYGVLNQVIGLDGALRSVYIGSMAGSGNSHSGVNHTVIGYDAQNARPNTFNTLLGSGTRAYNTFGDLATNGGAVNYATVIGAGAVVRTSNTLVLGRSVDRVVIGGESSTVNAKLQVYGKAYLNNASLTGTDNISAFIEMMEATGSGGPFIQANTPSALIFEVSRTGVVTMREQEVVPPSIEGLGRLFFQDQKLKFMDGAGTLWIVQAVQPEP